MLCTVDCSSTIFKEIIRLIMFKVTLTRVPTSGLRKCLCTLSSPNYVLSHLKERSLISLVGEEAPVYLQGLITNDIQHLSKDHTSQYAMFLNSKGRALYDTIIYRIDSKTFFVECDSSIATTLEKHLKIYRLRRKIDVLFLTDYKVYSLFNKDCYEEIINSRNSNPKSSNISTLLNVDKLSTLNIFKDPRISQLGYRIIHQKDLDIQKEIVNLLKINIDTENKLSYRKFRYNLGVGEGVTDLPVGNCFPLESNCDYLHGVSFHKGCYIGQELTARTFHTGVTRKRLMPVHFNENLKEIPVDDTIVHEKLKLGKLRGVDGNVGLALLRVDLINSIKNLKIAGIDATIEKPFWWPIEAPKEKLNLKK